ncbi:MAG TPA: hypothetical protein K8V30_03440 [Metalysinibacillus jejuensis]|uniref:Uncharacterized protein n=1 Tax=Metalysinibacillus jejuensis TaxID=914327 RepID=A0A921T574_9BACL|nr:hypothetical protein [Metalysinibacillus jejuensis]HJH10744.1 hypothetical protein [Metalysinibacillus jejuensis]
MACVNETGALTESARKLLTVIRTEAKTVEDIAKEASLPLFKVRSSVRELAENDFLFEKEPAKYMVTFLGNKRLEAME